MFEIPALMDKQRTIIPAFSLGNVEYRTDREGNTMRAADYIGEMQLPTLAELRHAYFGKTLALDREKSRIATEGEKENATVPVYTPDWISPDYRQDVLSKRGRGEWTSTFLRDGEEVIERPAKVSYDEKHDLWIAEGTPIRVELPPDGWALEYDKPTGFPSRTLPGNEGRRDAERVFGDDASYFYANRNGLRAVFRDFLLSGNGSFCVSADCGPGNRDSFIGGRLCRRPEQDAQRLATPAESTDTVTMSLKEYMTLMENYRQLTESHDRVGQEYQVLSEVHQRIGDLLARINVQK